MSRCTDDFVQPWTESHYQCGQSLHTQESGHDGLSSNMVHFWSEEYRTCDAGMPVADRGSLVKPIPNEGQEMFKSGVMTEDFASVKESAAHDHTQLPLPDSEKTPRQERGIDAPKRASPGYTCDAEEGPAGAEQVRNGHGLFATSGKGNKRKNSKLMLDAPNQEKPKAPPIPPERQRSRSRFHRDNKRRRDMWMFQLCVAVGLLHVPLTQAHVAFPRDAQHAVDQNLTCFACLKDGCQNLETIYGLHDAVLYSKTNNGTFPECSDLLPPPPDNCSVCLVQGNTTIVCSETDSPLEVEDATGHNYHASTRDCPTMKTFPSKPGPDDEPKNHWWFGLIGGAAAIFIVVAVLLYCCWRARRGETGPL